MPILPQPRYFSLPVDRLRSWYAVCSMQTHMTAHEGTRWIWARSPRGVRLEVAAPAMMSLLVLDDQTQRRLQQMLVEIADTNLALSWPRVPLQLTLGRTTVRYSLDPGTPAIVVDHVVTPEDHAG